MVPSIACGIVLQFDTLCKVGNGISAVSFGCII